MSRFFFHFQRPNRHIQDASEKVINITSLEFAAAVPSSVSSSENASAMAKNNDDDEDNGSDLRADVKAYPAGWNFRLKSAKSQYRPPMEIPAEETGHGVNRHVYFVCSNLASEWIELPPATPHQINVSRRIKKYLTGDLNAFISSYPAFPGTERNYLRALIARISAGTNIAPRNFFVTGSNEENEDEDTDEDYDASLSKSTFMAPELIFH